MKRRKGGKLRKITDEDRKKRYDHDNRTGRPQRVYDKKKVVPTDGSKGDDDGQS